MNRDDLDSFTLAYIECALWSSTECDEEGNMGEPLDANYSADDITDDTLSEMISECADFQESNAELLAGLDPAQCGHDFWLTRNGHGAGFWDRGLGERGELLSKASKVYGSVDLMAWDGKVQS